MFRLPLLTLFAIVAQARRAGSLPSSTSSLRGGAFDHEDSQEGVRSGAAVAAAAARSDVVLATVLSPGGGINAAEYYMLDGGDAEFGLDEDALWHLEQLDNVMVPEHHEIDVEGNDQHGRMLLSVSLLELYNAGYIQSTRVQRGRQRVSWATDLVAEAVQPFVSVMVVV